MLRAERRSPSKPLRLRMEVGSEISAGDSVGRYPDLEVTAQVRVAQSQHYSDLQLD